MTLQELERAWGAGWCPGALAERTASQHGLSAAPAGRAGLGLPVLGGMMLGPGGAHLGVLSLPLLRPLTTCFSHQAASLLSTVRSFTQTRQYSPALQPLHFQKGLTLQAHGGVWGTSRWHRALAVTPRWPCLSSMAPARPPSFLYPHCLKLFTLQPNAVTARQHGDGVSLCVQAYAGLG